MRRQRWIGAADRALMARVARTDSVVLDQLLPALGRAANYSRLWLGVSAGLAATRDQRARRGALRGLIGLAIASTTVNVVTKRAAGRVRPAADLTPLIRRLAIAPRTTSFPSGHSASAAAFATGVLLENPLLGAPVAVLGAAVAASRVATGAHYPSDVVVGTGIGVAAGLLTQTWWPRRPLAPADAAPRLAPALPTGDGLIVVANGESGSVRNGILDQVSADLPAAKIVTANPADDLAALLTDAAAKATVLGVAGGDGTVNLAARIAAERDLPLFVVPAGTLNHFARDLGVPTARDATTALRAGDAIRVDLAKAGDQVFVNTASIGLYVDLVRFREHWEKRLGKWPAMLVGLVHVLRHTRPHPVEVDGTQRNLWMLFAGNCRYLPAGFAPTSRPRLDDGVLDVRIVDASRPYARTRVVLGALTRTLRWCGPYESSLRPSLRVVSGEPLSVDGEVTDAPPVIELSKFEGALTVYRPARLNGRAG
jgi:undecaprenyl-diphosphatase